jgi:hypothetical protein
MNEFTKIDLDDEAAERLIQGIMRTMEHTKTFWPEQTAASLYISCAAALLAYNKVDISTVKAHSALLEKQYDVFRHYDPRATAVH